MAHNRHAPKAHCGARFTMSDIPSLASCISGLHMPVVAAVHAHGSFRFEAWRLAESKAQDQAKTQITRKEAPEITCAYRRHCTYACGQARGSRLHG